MGRTLAKMMRGAGEVAVPMLLEQHKAQIDQMRQDRLNAFRSGERLADQGFRAAEATKDRAHQMKLQGLKNQSKTSGTPGKIPEYDKALRRMAADTFNASLGDAYNFEGDNADKAGQLHLRAVQIINTLPEAERGGNTAWAYNQALQELREQEGTAELEADAQKQAEREAEGRKSIWDSRETEFEGMGQEAWTEQRRQQIIKNNAPDPFKSGSGLFREGKIYIDGKGNKARYVNGQWEPVR